MSQCDGKDDIEITEDVKTTSNDSRIDHLEMQKNKSESPSSEPSDGSATFDEETENQPLKQRSIITRFKNFEFPARDDGKPEIQPWDIDTEGQLLSEKKKNPKLTHYEKWLNKKRAKEGNEIICPNCGEINYELPYILGEKCKRCGFKYSEDIDIVTRMDDYDLAVKGEPKRKHLPDSPDDLLRILALPLKIRQNPNQEFKYKFNSRSYLVHILILIGVAIAAFVVLPSTDFLVQQENYITAMYVFIAIVGLFAVLGFARTLRVTGIEIEQDEVIFSSLFGATRMKYENILSIGNERHVTQRAFLMAGSFHLLIISIFRPFYYFDGDNISYNMDDSSTSRDYTNNFSISTAEQTVSFSFTGGENGQFIQAMASMIYLAKLKSKNCVIAAKAIKASEKGTPYYQSWRRGRGE